MQLNKYCLDIEQQLKAAQEELDNVKACSTSNPSSLIGLIENDNIELSKPLAPGLLFPKYIRNTNVTGVYEQQGENCYAFAACSAYINTIMRIYGSKAPPTFNECFKIANYNKNKEGHPEKSIDLLENHFHYGVLWEVKNKVSIRDILTLSVIACFSTSDDGWNDVANGGLVVFPKGIENGWHAVLVEGYDFENDYYICKNSWGGKTAQPRFNFVPSAAHQCYFVISYFTLNSIKGKITKIFCPNIYTFTGKLKGERICCAWMDKTTAEYCSDYVCEYEPNKSGSFNYRGYEINQWISIIHPNDEKIIALNSLNQAIKALYYRNYLFERHKQLMNFLKSAE